MAWTGSEDIGPMEKADAQLVERPRRLSTGGFRLFSRTKRVVLGVIILMTLIFFMPMDKIRLWHKSADNLDLEGASTSLPLPLPLSVPPFLISEKNNKYNS